MAISGPGSGEISGVRKITGDVPFFAPEGHPIEEGLYRQIIGNPAEFGLTREQVSMASFIAGAIELVRAEERQEHEDSLGPEFYHPLNPEPMNAENFKQALAIDQKDADGLLKLLMDGAVKPRVYRKTVEYYRNSFDFARNWAREKGERPTVDDLANELNTQVRLLKYEASADVYEAYMGLRE